MEEAASELPFSKLTYEIYLKIEIMMYVERQQSLEFMFGLNKKSRTFL